jgi:hypothetical protein
MKNSMQEVKCKEKKEECPEIQGVPTYGEFIG